MRELKFIMSSLLSLAAWKQWPNILSKILGVKKIKGNIALWGKRLSFYSYYHGLHQRGWSTELCLYGVFVCLYTASYVCTSEQRRINVRNVLITWRWLPNETPCRTTLWTDFFFQIWPIAWTMQNSQISCYPKFPYWTIWSLRPFSELTWSGKKASVTWMHVLKHTTLEKITCVDYVFGFYRIFGYFQQFAQKQFVHWNPGCDHTGARTFPWTWRHSDKCEVDSLLLYKWCCNAATEIYNTGFEILRFLGTLRIKTATWFRNNDNYDKLLWVLLNLSLF